MNQVSNKQLSPLSSKLLEDVIQEVEQETRFDDHLKQGLKQIMKTLKWGDPLSVLVKGHLFVESKLIELIEEELPNQGAIDLSRITFPTKLGLAVALELLPESERRGYAAFNALRNQVAHNYEKQLAASDENTLLKSLSKKLRMRTETQVSIFQRRKLPVFRSCVCSLCVDSLQRVLRNRNRHALARKWSDESFLQRFGEIFVEANSKVAPEHRELIRLIAQLITSFIAKTHRAASSSALRWFS